MSEKEYNILANKYNRLIAQYQNLEETHKNEKEKHRELKDEIKVLEDNMRKLCEEILAKDKSEMVLGTSYSWGGIDTATLINKASFSLKKYNKERAELMKRIAVVAEERGRKIENLQDQISQIMASGTDIVNKTKEDREEEEKAKKKLPYEMQQAEKEGKIQTIIVEDGDLGNDLTDNDIDPNLKTILTLNDSLEFTPAKVPVSDTRKKIAKAVEKKEEKKVIAHVINLKDYEDKLNNVAWKIIEIIGSEGLSEYNDIEQRVLESKVSDITSKIRYAMTSIESMCLLQKEQVSLPTKSKFFLFKLSITGSRLYHEKFGKDPVPSQIDIIEAEHDNLEHGYGIMEAANFLQTNPMYKSISTMNRANPLDVGNGLKYIPDIIAVTDKYTEYFEYERGNTILTDMTAKCNKMLKFTRFLNFIVPNKEIMTNKLIPQLCQFVKTRGIESLKGVRIRITTLKYFRDNKPGSYECWQSEYNMEKGEFIIRGN